MSRPPKPKTICSLPRYSAFAPSGDVPMGQPVQLSVEEFETIRLIDRERLDQAKCAEIMGVARSTVQRLYTNARRKIALSLVEGRMLIITGGDYTLCSKNSNEADFTD